VTQPRTQCGGRLEARQRLADLATPPLAHACLPRLLPLHSYPPLPTPYWRPAVSPPVASALLTTLAPPPPLLPPPLHRAAPYLVHSERFRKTLQQAGYEWDSSIIEPFNTASSPSWTQRTFPYSMDAGIPQVRSREGRWAQERLGQAGLRGVAARLVRGLHPAHLAGGVAGAALPSPSNNTPLPHASDTVSTSHSKNRRQTPHAPPRRRRTVLGPPTPTPAAPPARSTPACGRCPSGSCPTWRATTHSAWTPWLQTRWVGGLHRGRAWWEGKAASLTLCQGERERVQPSVTRHPALPCQLPPAVQHGEPERSCLPAPPHPFNPRRRSCSSC
jgi:hypothetical protein